jgi:hypothetical protein
MLMLTRTSHLATLALALILTLGLVGIVSAQSVPLPQPGALLQATEVPTIDPETPVVLTLGKAVTTPLDNQDVSYRIFTFSGKANQLMSISAQVMSGSMGVDLTINSQNDVELARVSGGFLQVFNLTVKLPQDGKYTLRLSSENPGAGDFEAGSVSVTVDNAKAATPTAAAK